MRMLVVRPGGKAPIENHESLCATYVRSDGSGRLAPVSPFPRACTQANDRGDVAPLLRASSMLWMLKLDLCRTIARLLPKVLNLLHALVVICSGLPMTAHPSP